MGQPKSCFLQDLVNRDIRGSPLRYTRLARFSHLDTVWVAEWSRFLIMFKVHQVSHKTRQVDIITWSLDHVRAVTLIKLKRRAKDSNDTLDDHVWRTLKENCVELHRVHENLFRAELDRVVPPCPLK